MIAMAQADVCISLISTNTCGLLKQCLESIYKVKPKANIETWVVDNVSTDGTSEMIREYFPQVKVITNISREGYGANHNKIVLNTNARYILTLNEDTILQYDTIDKMVSFMDLHPDAGAASCKVFFGDGQLQNNAGRFPTLFGEFLYFGGNFMRHGKKWYNRYKFMEDWTYNEQRIVDWVSGCFLIINTEIMSKVGGYHKEIFVYFEDTELCFRIKKKTGLNTYFVPDTSIIHFQGQSFNPRDFKREYFAFEGSCIYFRTAYGRPIETIYKMSCKTLWWLYFLITSFIALILKGTNKKAADKRDFYRFLLFRK
jgi:GT2 family glycosyltransferase